MTKEQIKAKIKALFFGCHATDIKENNALPEILNAVTDAAFDGANVQSDWNQADNTKADYIKNKPSLSNVMEITSLPTNGMTRDQVRAIGFTDANLEKVLNGEISFIQYGSGFHPIEFVYHNQEEDRWGIQLDLPTDTYDTTLSLYDITIANSGVTVGKRTLAAKKPTVKLSGLPTVGMTVAQLAAIGIDDDLLMDALAGDVTTLSYSNEQYTIIKSSGFFAMMMEFVFIRTYYSAADSALKGVQYTITKGMMDTDPTITIDTF